MFDIFQFSNFLKILWKINVGHSSVGSFLGVMSLLANGEGKGVR